MADKTEVIALAVTTGNTGWVQVIGDGNIAVSTGGNYGGATVALQARLIGYASGSECTIDDNGDKFTSAPHVFITRLTPQHEIRFTTVGGSGSQSINFYQSQYKI